MLNLRLTVFCDLLVASMLINVNAMSDEEIAKLTSAYAVRISTCSNELGISEEDIRATGRANTIDPCVAKCLLTTPGIIDVNGKWDVNKTYELNHEFFGNVGKVITKEQLMSNCASIKDVVFGKGAEDCKEALAVFECSLPFQERLLVFN